MIKAFFSRVKRRNNNVYYIDRVSKKKQKEKIYGEKALLFLYGKSSFWLIPWVFIARFFVAKLPFFSRMYGALQKTSYSRKKILPFIKQYAIDPEEFQDPVATFSSFNAFFIRKLKLSARPFDQKQQTIAAFAEGRYLVFPDVDQVDQIYVKGQSFSLTSLLQSKKKAETYRSASLVLARLCPADYHRFHFPVDCVPQKAAAINGPLYSVNPLALMQNIGYLWENARVVTELTGAFGQMLLIEIGATNVGSIIQTYAPKKRYLKGEE